MNKIDNTNQSLGLIEKVLAITEKYSVMKILKALAITLLVYATFTVAFNPEKIFKVYDEYKARLHDEAKLQRKKFNPEIQAALDRLRVNAKADRVLFLEYHNGRTSSGGLPFDFAAASFESLEDGVPPVSDQYSEVNLTLLPFANYINQHLYYVGNIESLKGIDKSLMYRMMANNVEHCAIMEVRGIKGAEAPLGILVLTYTHPIEHNCSIIKEKIQQTVLDIAVKLELKRK